jgi:hypothetical protein
MLAESKTTSPTPGPIDRAEKIAAYARRGGPQPAR